MVFFKGLCNQLARLTGVPGRANIEAVAVSQPHQTIMISGLGRFRKVFKNQVGLELQPAHAAHRVERIFCLRGSVSTFRLFLKCRKVRVDLSFPSLSVKKGCAKDQQRDEIEYLHERDSIVTHHPREAWSWVFGRFLTSRSFPLDNGQFGSLREGS